MIVLDVVFPAADGRIDQVARHVIEQRQDRIIVQCRLFGLLEKGFALVGIQGAGSLVRQVVELGIGVGTVVVADAAVQQAEEVLASL